MTAATQGIAPQNPANAVVITLSPAFKLVFLTIVGITVLTMIVSCYLVSLGPTNPPDPERSALLQAFATTWKLGFGAIVGLLGGKAF
jgi:hypothetical protein